MAGFADALYQRSPVWAQQAMVAAYGATWYRRRFGPAFHRIVAEFESRDRWSAEQFRDYQQQQLRELLLAAARSPYYREAFASAGFDAAAAAARDPLAALAHAPVLSKETLRVRARDLLTGPLPRGTFVQRSSGTTGTPTDVYFTREMHAAELAMPEARSLRWAGVSYRDRRLMMGSRKVCSFDQRKPPFWRRSPVEDLAYASLYHLSPANLPHYMAFLREFRPVLVMGYPNALRTVARYALDHGDLPAPARAVITTSETVTEQARAEIEAAWQCRVWDRYGAVECCLMVSQCAHGRYHVSPDAGILEVVDPEGRPCAPGVMGSVVCTGLLNRLQPLIRYRLGDAARLAVDQSCPCGRSMPILEAIEGRFEDMCFTADGRQMLRFDTVFKGISLIREAQVVQERLGLFTIQVVAAPGFGAADVRTLTGNMRLHMGDVETRVVTVDSIPRTAAGKFRAVVCRIPPGERPGG